MFVLNATPGVDLLLTASRTLSRGPRSGLAAACGISAGCIGHALAAAFGLAALLQVHAAAFGVVQWAGALYLAWLGVGMLRQAWRGQATVAAEAPVGVSLWSDFRTGAVTNLLNPKVALFFLAFLPQFVPTSSPSKTLSFLLLGLWFVLQSQLFLTAFVGLVALAARRSGWQTSARARRAFGGLGGLLFVALALRLAGVKPAGA